MYIRDNIYGAIFHVVKLVEISKQWNNSAFEATAQVVQINLKLLCILQSVLKNIYTYMFELERSFLVA